MICPRHLRVFISVVICILISTTSGRSIYNDYMQQRKQLIQDDSKLRIGGKLVLRSDEKLVSDFFMKEKTKIIESSRQNLTLYMPAVSFFLSKPQIDNSTLLKLIQRMPKGGALHLHDMSVTSLDWLIKNATYRDNVYMCVGDDSLINFHVFKSPPKHSDCVWHSVKDERAKAASVDDFDLMLKRNLSLLATDPLTTYPDNAHIWIRFARYFLQVYNLIFYAPIFKDYYWRTLEEFRADNVQYIELRGAMSGVFDLDHTVHNEEFGVQLYQNVTTEFVQAYPDFVGAKVIMSGSRNSKAVKILDQVKTAMYLNQKYPDFMMGYDLVGNEAAYNPLLFYINELLYPATQSPPYKLPYFFHAGETNWEGTDIDDNLADAILLNATRIGHGYALNKHPKLAQLVRAKNIPVEVNPISNQVLHLVSDQRNHPMASLMADNFPIVISSDDCATWEALPLSHDFYVAFMDMSGEDADLTFLKQLAINSIRYSAMSHSEKHKAMKLWETKWDMFIKGVIEEYMPSYHLK
ncbi:unnamed protein product [Candidula unifasciata]|uniref:adenosine deaminase n=1 Tax=Candidula unifasciata TaxID=100452 RepID=A0A8S3YPX0_9EUPU|nr:unnamed protein product [Candidula unifasciata]